MRIRKIFSLLDKSYLLLLALFFLPTQQSASAYNLGPDDVLSISVYGDTNLKTETRVSEDGRIIFPLIGSIEVGGKSSFELAIPSPKITRLLHEFYRFLRPGKCYRQLKNPQHSCPVNL